MGMDRRKILAGQTVGVILCGGKSLRMGQDKSGLRLKDTTLLEVTRQHLAAVTDAVFTAGKDGCDFVDAYKDKGPAMALFSLLEQAEIEDGARLLCMPVDMPLCSSVCLQAALDASRRAGTSVYAMNAVMPLVLRYSEDGFRQLQERVSDSKSLSLRGLLSCFNGEAVDLQSFGNELMNVNDPDDWAQLQAMAGQQD